MPKELCKTVVPHQQINRNALSKMWRPDLLEALREIERISKPVSTGKGKGKVEQEDKPPRKKSRVLVLMDEESASPPTHHESDEYAEEEEEGTQTRGVYAETESQSESKGKIIVEESISDDRKNVNIIYSRNEESDSSRHAIPEYYFEDFTESDKDLPEQQTGGESGQVEKVVSMETAEEKESKELTEAAQILEFVQEIVRGAAVLDQFTSEQAQTEPEKQEHQQLEQETPMFGNKDKQSQGIGVEIENASVAKELSYQNVVVAQTTDQSAPLMIHEKSAAVKQVLESSTTPTNAHILDILQQVLHNQKKIEQELGRHALVQEEIKTMMAGTSTSHAAQAQILTDIHTLLHQHIARTETSTLNLEELCTVKRSR